MTGRCVCAVLGATAALVSVMMSAPAMAKSGDIERAMEAAFTACHEWVTNPESWSEDIAGFPKTIGLDRDMESVKSVPNFALPPGDLQQGAIYWRLEAGKSDLYLAVSVSQPICRMAGGGPEDWQPAVETVLASKAFLAAWEPGVDQAGAGMRLSRFTGTADANLSLIVTRAEKAGAPAKDAQFLATARLR